MDDLKSTLEATGFPVAYHHFAEGEAVNPPFLCYYARSSHNFFADDAVHHPIIAYLVELYTEQKDPHTEAMVENALAAYGWEKSETYLESERLYEILYEIEV